MAERQWDQQFFSDDPMPVSPGSSPVRFAWPQKGTVLWAYGTTPNDLNPRINSSLRQPEVIDMKWDDIDRAIGWTLFVPSVILARDRAPTPASNIPVTLLLARYNEDVGYGLRVFFERAGTGALLCLNGRERKDPGGRWNVGVSQSAIQRIFQRVRLNGTPQVQVLAGYSTGYGVVQTINNELVPLAPVKRLIFFDCIYRTDKPALPSGESSPILSPKDRPEFSVVPRGLRVLDEGKEPFRERPFNTRRAINRLTGASNGCVVAGYSATSGGSFRYCIWRPGVDNSGKTTYSLVTSGTRPVVEIPVLAELRDMSSPSGSAWSPSAAFDMLALSRYLDLGIRAGLVSQVEIDRLPTFRDAISSGLPARGTVFASANTKNVAVVPPNLPSQAVSLLDWVSGLPSPPSWIERNRAATLVRDHQLVLPGWRYEYTDLDEFRHAATLSEFGWELLPPPVPVLTTIKVSPATVSLVVGGTQTFTTETLDQFSNSIAAEVTWSSSNTAVGTFDSAGRFTAKTAGTTTITASSGSVSGTATVTVK